MSKQKTRGTPARAVLARGVTRHGPHCPCCCAACIDIEADGWTRLDHTCGKPIAPALEL